MPLAFPEDLNKIKLVIIKNTKELNEVYMSKSAYESINEKDKIKVKIVEGEKDIFFDKNHSMCIY